MQLSSFWTRTLSGSIMMLIVCGAYFGGVLTMQILVSLILGAALIEWRYLINRPHDTCTASGRRFWKILGGLYITIPLISVIGFMDDLYSFFIPVVLGLIILSDVSGYLVGMTVGGPKIMPSISPNKTWSGTLAAVVIPGMVAHYGIPVFFSEEQAMGSILLFLTGFLGQVGDFLESKVKRYWGVKDSGNWIPGHGGILDRLDSVLMVFWGIVIIPTILYFGFFIVAMFLN